MPSLLDARCKDRALEAVREIETGTSAEVVVAVQHSAGSYRDVAYLVGFVVSMVTLLLLLFLPIDFPLEVFPVDVAASFGLSAFLFDRWPALLRGFVSRRRHEQALLSAARAAFVAQGVSRTRGRTGVLVFASLQERGAVVVVDSGVELALGAVQRDWRERTAALSSSVDAPDVFFERLKALGPLLSRVLPRQDDDVNELPDEVRAS